MGLKPNDNCFCKWHAEAEKAMGMCRCDRDCSDGGEPRMPGQPPEAGRSKVLILPRVSRENAVLPVPWLEPWTLIPNFWPP